MSNSPYHLLHLEPTAWQFQGGEHPGSRQTFVAGALVEQVPLMLEALQEAGQSGQPLVLGLDASWCLSATMEVASPQILRKPQLLHYQLEEWVPWSAEEYVSAFVGHRNQAFCVAVRYQGLLEFLQSLEAEDVLIAAVVPLALLAVADHLAMDDLGDHLLLWQDGQTVDLIAIRNHSPWQWSRVPADKTEIERHLQMMELSQESIGPIYTRGISIQIAEAIELPPVEQWEAASRASLAVNSGQQEPFVNLRQGKLCAKHDFEVLGRELKRLKLAIALFLMCLGVAFWVRGEQYRSVTEKVQSQLSESYQKLFPAAEVPRRVGVAIEKEYRLLRGTRAPASELPSPVAADKVLENVLQHLPANLRFRLPEIRIEHERVSLGGEVRSNADADQIATALRSHGFTVDPPHTQRLSEKGFGVRLQAKVEEPGYE